MKWYVYFAIIFIAALCYVAVVDIKTRKALKEKKEQEKAARKKLRNGKKKKSKK